MPGDPKIYNGMLSPTQLHSLSHHTEILRRDGVTIFQPVTFMTLQNAGFNPRKGETTKKLKKQSLNSKI